MKKDEFIALLSKKISGELSISESDLLQEAIQENEEFRLLALYLKGSVSEPVPAKPKDELWDAINLVQHGTFKGKFDYDEPKRNVPWLKVAAVFVLCTLGYYLLTADGTRGFDQIVTTSDKTFKVLNDGTKIWLNKESTVSFNKAFGVDKREVILVGEAYFDVAKNARIPLIITAGNIAIEVKGTAFNVNAYQQNPVIEVAMVRGEIAVADKDDRNRKVKLIANQMLTFSKSSLRGADHFQLMSVAPTMILKETKWRADTLVFRKEKLKDLALRLEKKYDLTIQIQSEQLKEKRFSGVFTTETIQQVLEALKLSYPLTYTISNRVVIIKD